MRFFGQQFEQGVLCNPISAITSTIGGIIGSNAANSAAKGINAADQTAAQSSIDTAAKVNPDILKTATDSGNKVIQTATDAGAGVIGASGTAATDMNAAAAKAAGGVDTATKTANDLLNPYASAGSDASATLQKGVAAGGDFNKTPTLADLQIDPGYAFRLQQGSAALDRSAAARGGAISGGNIKAQTDFAQGSASQEYQNAFSRFETSAQNRYVNLTGVANRGLTAGATQGTNTINSARYGGDVGNTAAMYGGNALIGGATYAGNANMNASQYAGNANINATNLTSANTINADKTASDYKVGGATAIGQGKMGAANAWTGALNGIGNAAMYGGVGGNLFSNPATSGAGPAASQPYYQGAMSTSAPYAGAFGYGK